MEKKYTFPEETSEMVRESIPGYAVDMIIPVRVPTMGKYTMDELVKKLTNFALALVKPEVIEQTNKHYSSRIMRLHANSQMKITPQDIAEDDRLAYLLNS